MTPSQFINAVNDNSLFFGTVVTSSLQGVNLNNAIESGYDSFKRVFSSLPAKRSLSIGMRGVNLIAALNANFESIDSLQPIPEGSSAAMLDGNTFDYYDPLDINNITKDADSLVSKVVGKINGNDLNQATGAKQLIWSENGILTNLIEQSVAGGLRNMTTGAKTWNAPWTLYAIISLRQWNNYKWIFGLPAVYAYTETPKVDCAGAEVPVDLNEFGLLRIICTVAQTKIKWNRDEEVTVTVAGQNPGGLFIGSDTDETYPSRSSYADILCRNVADSGGTLAALTAFMEARLILRKATEDALVNNRSSFIKAVSGVDAVWQHIVEDVASYKFRFGLKKLPTSNVVATLSAQNDFITFASTEITFTPDNYLFDQTVILTGKSTAAWRTTGGVHDENIIVTLSSEDPQYDGVVKSFPVKVAATELNYIIWDEWRKLNAGEISVLSYDVERQYHFENEADLAELRESIIDDIWLGAGLPTKAVPDAIDLNFVGDAYFNPSSANLSSITKVTWMVGQDYGCYHFHCIPINGNGKVVFSPFGHGQTWTNINTDYGIAALITQLLDAGYYVICSYPVGFGSNKAIKEDVSQHHDFSALEYPGVYNPLELFLNHWIYEYNYLKANFNFTEFSMIGHSGGGWTTVLVSALIEEITKSFAIAGGIVPLFLYAAKSAHYENGNLTEESNVFFNNYTYLDFYALASWKRHHHHIMNPPEWGGEDTGYDSLYKDSLDEKIATLEHGGEFTIDRYSYPSHYVNQDCIDIIFSYL